MNKREFEKFVLRNIESIKSFHCNIVDSLDMDGEMCCWLDVYISGDEYTTVFCSDNFPPDSKEVLKLQSYWVRKLKGWINPNWDIPLEIVRISV